MTREEAWAMVRKGSFRLRFVPKELQTQKLCILAVLQESWGLRHVPEELRTPEVCLAAVQRDGANLEFVPEEGRTPDICMAAVQNEGRVLCHVPEACKTEAICLEAVRKDGYALKWVPERLRTPEICETAIRQDNRAVAFVPESFWTIRKQMQNQSFAYAFFNGFCAEAPEWYKGEALEKDCDSQKPFSAPWHWAPMEDWFDATTSPKEMGASWAKACAQRMEEERTCLEAKDEEPLNLGPRR